MFDFYTRFYQAVASSAANAEYCARVYGRNLCQHGFADLDHLDYLIQVSGISAGSRVLDLGCGNGMIAEYLADQTGARVTGIDFIERAIGDAQARTAAKRERLEFRVMDMSRLDFPPASFNVVIAIGFFEAIFWRGWVLLRLEEAFGIIPAILVGLVLCAAYHIGYGMAASKMIALFFVGVMFAMVFRLTNNVFILWPIFQPMGQLVTLIRDGLTLPPMAALGVIEVLILMFVFVWLAARRQRKHSMAVSAA